MGEIAAAISHVYAAGDDLSLRFTVVDSDGNAVDITGHTPRFAIVRRVGGTPVISTEASPATATATLTTPASGIFTVTVDGAKTAALSGTYAFEAEVQDASSDKSTVTRGFIDFIPAIL